MPRRLGQLDEEPGVERQESVQKREHDAHPVPRTPCPPPWAGVFLQGSGSEVIARIRHLETDGAVNTTRTLELSRRLSKRGRPPNGTGRTYDR
jgi:hypothetical protein